MGVHVVPSLLFMCFLLNFVTSEDWSYHIIMDESGRYHLYWTPPENRAGDSEIRFKVEVRTTGYVGIGLSPNGGMPGSDIVTMWIKDGEIYFQDRHATAFALPPLDDVQNYKLISGDENDTHTIFTFRRKLDTCDDQDMVIDDSTMRVIYAFSEEDPDSDEPFYHGQNRGSRSVLLLQNNVRNQPDLDFSSLLKWDVRSPDIDISDYDTLYWCKIFKTPNVSEKHHIVYVKPIIQEGNDPYVHHILFYECVGGTPEEYEKFLDYRGHDCNDPNMPISMQNCEGVTVAWAIGGADLVLPEHAGLPLYPGQGTYYLIQIHYDNPQLQQGIVDNSGLTFYYTPELRQYDAGTLQIGSTVTRRMFIPPRQKEYTVTGHSNPDCFRLAFPEKGIKAIASLLHAHLLGRQLKARHFRGKQELVPLAEDKNYDFNYQEYRHYNEEVVILPDDQISVECKYDSSQRNQVTFGGHSTREEMCLVFTLYYPKVEIYASVSIPTFDSYNKVLNTNSSQVEEILEDLRHFDWENANISYVENIMTKSKQKSECHLGNGEKDSVQSLISYPKDFEPYIEESTCNDPESL